MHPPILVLEVDMQFYNVITFRNKYCYNTRVYITECDNTNVVCTVHTQHGTSMVYVRSYAQPHMGLKLASIIILT